MNHDTKHRERPAEREPWLGVELRHLAALLAVARTGSFRRAADELGYVQSAISQQIAFLEQLVGTRLIERTRGMRGVSVTQAGEALLTHAEHIVGRFHAAKADLDAIACHDRPLLRLGVPHGVAAGLLPPILCRLAADAPGLRVVTTEDAREEALLQLVEKGELDAAFAELPVPSEALETTELQPDPYVLIAASGSRLARIARPLTFDDLRDEPLLVHDAFPDVEQHARAHGVEPRVAFRSESAATIEAMVAAGIGAAIVPTLALGQPMAGTARIDLADGILPRAIGICRHRARRQSGAVDALCAAARIVQEGRPALAEAA